MSDKTPRDVELPPSTIDSLCEFARVRDALDQRARDINETIKKLSTTDEGANYVGMSLTVDYGDPSVAKPCDPIADDSACRHSPDFASVFWYGTQHDFTPSQAACVKVLWDAMENGTPTVGQAAILENAGVASAELRQLFREHAAWGTMILSPSKGRYRLQRPEISRPSGKTHG